MSDDPSDYMLLERAKQGEESAFVLLYERHRDSVYRFVFRMLGSVETAEDITHDRQSEIRPESRAVTESCNVWRERGASVKEFREGFRTI